MCVCFGWLQARYKLEGEMRRLRAALGDAEREARGGGREAERAKRELRQVRG